MKPLVGLLFMTLVAAGASGPDDAAASVRFSNNDRLAGSLVQLTPELLVWKSPALATPTAFFLKNVMDIALPATTPAPAADYEATLKLTNGDTVCGQLAALNPQEISMDTWFAGRLTFRRVMVADVKITAKSALFYRGPNSLDGWQQTPNQSAWTYNRGSFVSHAAGHITHDDLLPDDCSITFDVTWKGDSLGLKVLALTRDSGPESTSGYEMSFQHGSISLRNCATQNFLGATAAQAFMENDRARIEIRASAKSGKVCLLVNDHLIETWTDPDADKGGFGQGLRFVALNTTPLRISSIDIAPWDGAAEVAPQPRIGIMRQFGITGTREEPNPVATEKPGEGRMELANGDSLCGEALSISDGVITVKTPIGIVELPLARLRTLALLPSNQERCKRRNGDIRAWFTNGSSIVFQLDEIKDDSLIGSSQNFGSASFKIAAFSRLEFNIHDPILEDKRALQDW